MMATEKHAWRRDLVLFGALLILLFGVGFASLTLLIERIESERDARVAASGALIEQVCRRDNSQDRALAALVRTSIVASEDPRVDHVFAEVLDQLTDQRHCEEIARRYVRGIS